MAESANNVREVNLGKLSALKLAAVPAFTGVLAYIGPGIVWAGLAQGSGELIWWPYLTAKYGGAFLGLLIPASLMQFWVNLEIARYTITTGETMMTGFSRIGKWYATLVWVGIIIENIWFGAYASAGGTALADLTHFPAGWSPRAQSLFWAYLTIFIYLLALFLGRVVYKVIEKVTMTVVVITIGGVLFAVFQPKVLAQTGAFFASLFSPYSYKPYNWEPKDIDTLLTGLAFAGAGGFGQFFFGYWLRDKGIGMAKYIGRITSPITGTTETIPATGYAFEDTEENRRNYSRFIKYISFENGMGIFLNLLTTIIMCWLAWSLLMPEGKVPQGWQIAVVQSAFFEVAWGKIGRILFLIVAAAFLCDAWLQLTDGFSRVQADFVYSNFKGASKFHFRTWYYIFVVFFTLLTTATMPLKQPGSLIILRGTIAFLAMGLYCPALIYLNYYLLPKAFPKWTKPHPITKILMYLVTITYVIVGLVYLYFKVLG